MLDMADARVTLIEALREVLWASDQADEMEQPSAGLQLAPANG